jgi:nucleoid DNA-binding protein
VNKSELVKSLAEKAEITQKDAAKALDATVEVIQTALANGDKVQIIGFGSFEVRDRKERKVISPANPLRKQLRWKRKPLPKEKRKLVKRNKDQ